MGFSQEAPRGQRHKLIHLMVAKPLLLLLETNQFNHNQLKLHHLLWFKPFLNRL